MVAARAVGGGCGQRCSDRLGCQHAEALVPSAAAQLARPEGLFVWNPGCPTARQTARTTGAACRGGRWARAELQLQGDSGQGVDPPFCSQLSAVLRLLSGPIGLVAFGRAAVLC